jgi:hypothetical protein
MSELFQEVLAEALEQVFIFGEAKVRYYVDPSTNDLKCELVDKKRVSCDCEASE